MRKDWGILLGAALAVAFGLQELRAFFPSMVYVLKDRFQMSSVTLGAVGVAWFGLGGLVAAKWVGRQGARRGLPFAILASAALRFALQAWRGDPTGFLVLAGLGTFACFAVLAALIGQGRPFPVFGFLVGASIDVFLHAAQATQDLHWVRGPVAVGLAALAAVAASLAAIRALGRDAEPGLAEQPVAAIALLAWGPFLFLHLEWLANVARLSAKAGVGPESAGAVVLTGFAIALGAAAIIPRHRLTASLAGATLVGATALSARSGLVSIAIQLAAIVSAAFLMREIVGAAADRPHRGAALGASGGAVVLLLFVFAHYAGYDLPLPWSRTQVWIAAAAMLAACALSRRASPVHAAPPSAIGMKSAVGAGILAGALAILPMLRREAERPAEPPLPSRLKVVTFNLHAGFDERGAFAFGAMMDSVRAQHADVIALQEVSRGWLINGCADLAVLARRALPRDGGDMRFSAFGASIDSDWGNAVFSVAPIARWANTPLPPRNLELTRAVLEAQIPVAGAAALRVLATHFHHRAADELVRETHARFLVERFGGRGAANDSRETPAILLGDFNATPGSASLRILEDAGWIDAAGDGAHASVGADAAVAEPTYPSRAPERRIDFIYGRGLAMEGDRVAPAWGSDHRAVVAMIGLSDRDP